MVTFPQKGEAFSVNLGQLLVWCLDVPLGTNQPPTSINCLLAPPAALCRLLTESVCFNGLMERADGDRSFKEITLKCHLVWGNIRNY